MDFWQQVLSTLIGTFAGFLLSLALFYLTETWKNSRTRKDLGANIAKEIQFNLDFLTQYKTDFEKMLRQVTAGDKQIFTVFRHNKLQRLFLQEAFQKGLLYKNLSTDEVVAVDAMLSYFLPYRDQILWTTLNEFQNGQKDIQATLFVYEWDREQIEKYIKLLNTLKSKMKKL
jgi:hypothetical protein